MEAFSDGVFAIAITLLVLELTVPVVIDPESGLDVLGPIARQWPMYLAYIVSFASIGSAWIAHSTITEYLERADPVLIRLNLLLLSTVSLLPFPTRMLGEYVHEIEAERVAATIYGVNLLAIAAVTSVLWHHAVAAKLVKDETSDDDVRDLTTKLTPSLAFYAVTIGVGLLFPRVAVIMYLAIALFLLIPLRTVLRYARRRTPEG
jgi:uncharacterized membrane protein